MRLALLSACWHSRIFRRWYIRRRLARLGLRRARTLAELAHMLGPKGLTPRG